MKKKQMKTRIQKARGMSGNPAQLVRYLRRVRDGWVDKVGYKRDGFNSDWAGAHVGRLACVAVLEAAIRRADGEEMAVTQRRRARAAVARG